MFQMRELIIELSNNCNLACKMCGFWQAGHDPKRFMGPELFKKVLGELGPFAKAIRLNGRGESTIHPKFLQMLEQTRHDFPRSDIILFTNASFKSPKVLSGLVRNDVQLFLSIDSPVRFELENIRVGCDYDTVLSNIEGLSQMDRRPNIIFTMQEENLHRILDIAKFALQHRSGIIYNTVRRDEGNEPFVDMVKDRLETVKNDFQEVRDLYKGTGLLCLIPDQISGIALGQPGTVLTHGQRATCPALSSELCVLYNGDVTPCNMFNPYVFGNLVTDDIKTILNGKERKVFLSGHKEHYYCRNCACMGGGT